MPDAALCLLLGWHFDQPNTARSVLLKPKSGRIHQHTALAHWATPSLHLRPFGSYESANFSTANQFISGPLLRRHWVGTQQTRKSLHSSRSWQSSPHLWSTEQCCEDKWFVLQPSAAPQHWPTLCYRTGRFRANFGNHLPIVQSDTVPVRWFRFSGQCIVLSITYLYTGPISFLNHNYLVPLCLLTLQRVFPFSFQLRRSSLILHNCHS